MLCPLPIFAQTVFCPTSNFSYTVINDISTYTEENNNKKVSVGVKGSDSTFLKKLCECLEKDAATSI